MPIGCCLDEAIGGSNTIYLYGKTTRTRLRVESVPQRLQGYKWAARDRTRTEDFGYGFVRYIHRISIYLQGKNIVTTHPVALDMIQSNIGSERVTMWEYYGHSM